MALSVVSFFKIIIISAPKNVFSRLNNSSALHSINSHMSVFLFVFPLDYYNILYDTFTAFALDKAALQMPFNYTHTHTHIYIYIYRRLRARNDYVHFCHNSKNSITATAMSGFIMSINIVAVLPLVNSIYKFRISLCPLTFSFHRARNDYRT